MGQKFRGNTPSVGINAALNAIRQCCAILFPLITFPYVSRILGSEGIGAYSFAWSVTSYFVLIGSFGISTYTVREGARVRDNQVAINKFCSEVYSVNIITSLISLIALAMCVFSFKELRPYALYIFIQSVAIILGLIGKDWVNSIYEDYTYITVRYIVIQVLAIILMFIFVRNKTDVWKYCTIAVFSSFAGNIPNLVYIRKYVKIEVVFSVDILKHVMPMLVFFVTGMAITIYVNADITMLGFFATDKDVGVYTTASKIYSMTKQVVNAVIIVTLPRLSYVVKNGTKDAYNQMVSKVFSYISIILFPLSAGIYALGDCVILLVGGREYISGEGALKLLAVAIVFAVYCSFFMNCVLATNKAEKKTLIATCVAAITNVGLNVFLLPQFRVFGAAFTTVVAELVSLCILLQAGKRYFTISKVEVRCMVKSIISSAFVVIVCLITKHYLENLFAIVIVSAMASGVVYLLCQLILNNEYVKDACQICVSKVTKK